jgi:tRNA (mo5U34)-methyltransferase
MTTREDIRERVDKLGPWFHCIDLGDGIKTKLESVAGEPADHPNSTWEIIRSCLPEDLSEKSVLDVGCNAGFYSIEAKRRGAARVLGVDAQRHLINQALFVRRVLGLDIEYRRMSVYDVSRSSIGEFDVTLALGLIYHCKHLVLALEKLFEVTKELLIIETAILPQELAPDSFIHPAAGPSVHLHPLVYAENSGDLQEPVYNWFLPGTKSLEALLKNVGFTEVSFFNLQPERAVVLCRKSDSSSSALVLSQFSATLEIVEGPRSSSPGVHMTFKVKVHNSGYAAWPVAGGESDRGVVKLGAHLLDSNEEPVLWDYWRAAISHELKPEASDVVTIALRAPDKPGKYIVEFDMVLEHISWFEDLGTQTVRQRIEVR